MNTQTTLQEGKDYEVVVDAYVTNEDLEVNSIMFHCRKTMTAVDITDFLYDYLSVDCINDLDQRIINNAKD
jgi:hypothetical protein|tara:strand:- start:723 stop:935 length:213 start_codon:yes stop_codon:yes gene_type:complete